MTRIIKKIYKKLFIIIVLITVIYLIFFSRFRMLNLPTGEYIESVVSPDGSYTLKSYIYGGKGIMDDWSLRVELVNNKTNKIINIYYKYHENESNIEWIDKQTVKINNNVLNIHKDYIYEN